MRDGSRTRSVEREIRIVIVDDHALFAQTLAAALQSNGIEVAGIACSPSDALELVERTEPDLILLDIGIHDHEGIALARRLIAQVPTRGVIALTALDSERSRREAMQAGLRGYLLKGTSLDELVSSFRSVLGGSLAFGPRALPAPSSEPAEGRLARLHSGSLTAREQQILQLLARGLSSEQIAEDLHLKASTVRTHVQSILEKLQVHSRLEAASLARRIGLIDP